MFYKYKKNGGIISEATLVLDQEQKYLNEDAKKNGKNG